jgi:hypothetical protein
MLFGAFHPAIHIIDDLISDVVGPQAPFRVPHAFFWSDVFLHELGDDLVLVSELGLELPDLTIFGDIEVDRAFGPNLERSPNGHLCRSSHRQGDDLRLHGELMLSHSLWYVDKSFSYRADIAKHRFFTTFYEAFNRNIVIYSLIFSRSIDSPLCLLTICAVSQFPSMLMLKHKQESRN